MGPLSKSWLRPTATCHQIVVESTSTLKTCLRNHDWGPISSKSCALLGHQLSTHLLIEFYMISSTTWRSNQTSILSHGNHSPSYSSFFPPSQFGSSPSDPRIRSPRSAHLDDNFLARPYSALSSTRQTLCTAPDHQRYLKTPSLLVNIPIYFSWPKYDTPPTAMASYFP